MKTLIRSLLFPVFIVFLFACNQNEHAPVVVDQEFTVKENSPGGTIFGAVEAEELDEGQALSFEIREGNNDQTFSIHPSNGILSVNDPEKLDYETVTEFILEVVVTDSHEKDPLESTATVRINITDENEFAPVPEPAYFTVPENPANGLIIGTLQASDGDIHQQLYFKLLDEQISNVLALDSVTGSLSISDSTYFDYESVKQFSFQVQVTDNGESPLSGSAEYTIYLIDLVEFHDGLIAWFPFSGNAIDESGNGVNGQVSGALPTADRFGRLNSAYAFDGIDDYINLENANALRFGSRDFSISVWYELTSQEIKPQDVISIYSSSGDQREFRLTHQPIEDSMYFMLYDYGTLQGDVLKYQKYPGWQHVVITKDDSELSLYLNGALYKSIPVTAQLATSTSRAMIGAVDKSTTSPDVFFDGKIDDICIYERVLEEWEIVNLFEAVQ